MVVMQEDDILRKKKIKGVYNLGSIGGISKGIYIYKFFTIFELELNSEMHSPRDGDGF